MRTYLKLPESARNCREAANLLTIPEFCSATRISVRQYFRLRASGCGPRIVRLGGKVLHNPYEVQRWLREWTE